MGVRKIDEALRRGITPEIHTGIDTPFLNYYTRGKCDQYGFRSNMQIYTPLADGDLHNKSLLG